MKLSILVCRLPSRYRMWGALQTKLWGQMLPYSGQIELLSNDSLEISIGEKRNHLLDQAQGEYICFIDDDDDISEDYVRLLMDGIESKADALSLRGMYSVDGKEDGIFEHSLKYSEWKTTKNEVKYERFHNHLNTIKSSIAKQFKFTEKNHGEDFDWSTLIHQSGLITTEHFIPEIIYYYNYVSNKK